MWLDRSGPLYSLAPLAGARAFRYRAHFDCTGVPGPLVDTPVLESLWFAVRRRGRAPLWRSWTFR